MGIYETLRRGTQAVQKRIAAGLYRIIDMYRKDSSYFHSRPQSHKENSDISS